MKTLKEIKKDYYEQDRKAMRDGLKYLQVFEYVSEKKANKRELKKADAEIFWSGVFRATFHMTAVRYINWKAYLFKSKYLFINQL